MSLAKILWEENADLAQAALENIFVDRLRKGTLPATNFQSYIAQDVYFIEAAARAHALALARTPDTQDLLDFFDVLAGEVQELKRQAEQAAKRGAELRTLSRESNTIVY